MASGKPRKNRPANPGKKAAPKQASKARKGSRGRAGNKAGAARTFTLAGDASSMYESRNWMRWLNHRLIHILLVSVVMNLVFGGAALLELSHHAKPGYFAVTPDFRVKKLTPLNKPYVSNGGLITWVTRTVAKTFVLSPLNYKSQLAAVEKDYTKNGFDQLIQSMKANGIFTLVSKQRMNTSLSIDKAPTINYQGLANGVYVWKIAFPVTISYEGSSSGGGASTQTQRAVAHVVVRRANLGRHPRGVIIRQLDFTSQ